MINLYLDKLFPKLKYMKKRLIFVYFFVMMMIKAYFCYVSRHLFSARVKEQQKCTLESDWASFVHYSSPRSPYL